MSQSGHKKWEGNMTPSIFRELIKERIKAFDVISAVDDVKRFISHRSDLSIWTREFFFAVAEKIRFI
jgi:hypothetical protein